MGPFADRHVQSLTDAQAEAFEVLLDLPDHDVYGWIVSDDPAPEPYETDLIALIRAFRSGGGARIV